MEYPSLKEATKNGIDAAKRYIDSRGFYMDVQRFIKDLKYLVYHDYWQRQNNNGSISDILKDLISYFIAKTGVFPNQRNMRYMTILKNANWASIGKISATRIVRLPDINQDLLAHMKKQLRSLYAEKSVLPAMKTLLDEVDK